jgi:hypothetical protein
MTEVKLSRYNSLLWQTRANIANLTRKIDGLHAAQWESASQRMAIEAHVVSLEAQLAGHERLLAWIFENVAVGDKLHQPHRRRHDFASALRKLWPLRGAGAPIRL